MVSDGGGGGGRKTGDGDLVCISHREDLDGVGAAAIIKQAYGGSTVLVNYSDMLQSIGYVSASEPGLGRLFVCDLGLDAGLQDDFVRLMDDLQKRRVSVTYVDHHAAEPDVLEKLSGMGVRVMHDVRDCASVLLYEAFKSDMTEHARFTAACAAVSDHMEDGPAGGRLFRTYDRNWILTCAMVMNYYVADNQKDTEGLMQLVNGLANANYPHQMPGVFEAARDQTAAFPDMIETVGRELKKRKNLACFDATGTSIRRSVNTVLGLSGMDVALTYKGWFEYDLDGDVEGGNYNVSVRGTDGCAVHLGELVGAVASGVGGSGGGHAKACGATIPMSEINRFIDMLDAELGARACTGDGGCPAGAPALDAEPGEGVQ